MQFNGNIGMNGNISRIYYYLLNFDQCLLKPFQYRNPHLGMGQNPIPLVNIKIAGKWMVIPLKIVLIGIDPYPFFLHNEQRLMNHLL